MGMRFMELLRYLKTDGANVEYALLTDGHDVTFRKDPLKLMRSIDETMESHSLFGQDDWRPRVPLDEEDTSFTALNRGISYWKDCFNTTMPEAYQADKFYNCGLLGGHRSVLVPFLERMKYWYQQVPVESRYLMCDMFIFSRTVMEDFNDHMITGYPFHAHFNIPDKDSIAAIYHKSSWE